MPPRRAIPPTTPTPPPRTVKKVLLPSFGVDIVDAPGISTVATKSRPATTATPTPTTTPSSHQPQVEARIDTTNGFQVVKGRRIGLVAVHPGIGRRSKLWMVTSLTTGRVVLQFAEEEQAVTAAEILMRNARQAMAQTEVIGQRGRMPWKIREWIKDCWNTGSLVELSE